MQFHFFSFRFRLYYSRRHAGKIHFFLFLFSIFFILTNSSLSLGFGWIFQDSRYSLSFCKLPLVSILVSDTWVSFETKLTNIFFFLFFYNVLLFHFCRFLSASILGNWKWLSFVIKLRNLVSFDRNVYTFVKIFLKKRYKRLLTFLIYFL